MRLSDLLVPSTKYSKFRCDTYKKFSANPGILYPVWFDLLNPGESVSLDLRSVIRTWPVLSPLMGSMKVRFVTAAFNLKNYAMALEGYNREFDWRSVSLPHIRFTYPLSNTPTDYLLPFIEIDDDGETTRDVVFNVFKNYRVHQSSLADYLGYENNWLPTSSVYVPTDQTSIGEKLYLKKSFLPFICYYDFYRNYLVNPQEALFPMFVSSYDESIRYGSTSADRAYYSTLYSSIRMTSLANLDAFIANCHKYYDSNGNLPINHPDSSVYASFSNLFSWETDTVVPFTNADTDPTYYKQILGNTFSTSHGGLVSTTFDGDINTQWLSTDNYKKLNEVKINTRTDSGSSDIYTSFSDIVKASSLWDFMTRSVNSDGTYGDFIGNQFGVTVKGDMNIPQIVHVYDTLLSFDDITSQSATDDAVLGQQGGVGRSFGQSNSFRVVNKDGNYIMLMTFMWVTPQICYSTGLGHLHDIVSFSDLYQPSFDNYAMQGRLQERVHSMVPSYNYVGRNSIGPESFPLSMQMTDQDYANVPLLVPGAVRYNANLGYQPAWADYKTNIDVVHGMFRNELDYYTIIRDVPFISTDAELGLNNVCSAYVYSANTVDNIIDAQSAKRYILPFAIEEEDCLQVQLRVDATFTRAMSKNVNPNVK